MQDQAYIQFSKMRGYKAVRRFIKNGVVMKEFGNTGMRKAYQSTRGAMREACSGTRGVMQGAMREACLSPTRKAKKLLMIALSLLLVAALTPVSVFLFPKTAFAGGEGIPEEGVALAFPNINTTNPVSHWTQAMWDEVVLAGDFVGAEVIGSTYYSTNSQNSITFMVWNPYTNHLYVFVYCSHANHYVTSMKVAQADDPTPQVPCWQEKVNAPGHTVFEYTFSNGLPKNISINGGLNNGFDPGFDSVEFLALDTPTLDIVYDGQAHQVPVATATLANAVITYKNPVTGVWSSSLPIATVTDVTNGWIDIEVMATAPNVSNYTRGIISVRVTPRPIAVKPADASKVFDGEPLLVPHVVELVSASPYDLGLGHAFDISKATFTGSQTMMGSSNSTVSGVCVKDAGGKDVTGNYNISYAPGTLEITAASTPPLVTDDDDDAADDDDDDVVVDDDGDDDVVVDDGDNATNDDDDDAIVDDDNDDDATNDDDVVVDDDNDDVVVNDDDDDVVVTGTDNADDTPITPVIPVAPTVEPEVVDTPAPPSTPTIPIVDQDPPLAPVTPAPLTRLQDDFVPLANINASSWALINLLLAGAGVLLALTVLAAVLTRRSDSDKAAAKNQRGKSLIWGSASFAAGLVALIVFFMTQDISAAMALVDGWTILHVVILIAQVALTVLAVSKKAFENSTLRFEEIAA